MALWKAQSWTPKQGHKKVELEAHDIKKAMKKAARELKFKGSGEISVTAIDSKGASVQDSPKESKSEKKKNG